MTGATDLVLIDTGLTRRGRAVFKLARPFVYRVRMSGDRASGLVSFTVKVPKGFLTDYASIPWGLHAVLSPTGPWRMAAVVHDYLCEIGFPRFLTDAIFRHIMSEHPDVRVFQRVLIYYGVRAAWICWGQFFWKRDAVRHMLRESPDRVDVITKLLYDEPGDYDFIEGFGESKHEQS